MKFIVVLAPESDGGYTAICPAIAGCASQGESRDLALANIKEAILLCLEVRAEDGMPLPTESSELIAQQVKDCLNDRKAEGLPLTIETSEVDVEAEVAV